MTSSPVRPLMTMDWTSETLKVEVSPLRLTTSCEVEPLTIATLISSLAAVPLMVSTPLTRPTERSRRDSRFSNIESCEQSCLRVNIHTPGKLRKIYDDHQGGISDNFGRG